MRLMRHPLFRDAHGTDDHYAPVLFAAGAAGDQDDEGTTNTSPAEVWELEQMCNVRARPTTVLSLRLTLLRRNRRSSSLENGTERCSRRLGSMVACVFGKCRVAVTTSQPASKP